MLAPCIHADMLCFCFVFFQVTHLSYKLKLRHETYDCGSVGQLLAFFLLFCTVFSIYISIQPSDTDNLCKLQFFTPQP